MKINDNITITNEDNMLLMARYPDNYFDIAFDYQNTILISAKKMLKNFCDAVVLVVYNGNYLN